MSKPSFDLIKEPWIPVVTSTGEARTMGLRDVLVRSHALRELADASPLTTFAIYRLLLALIHSVLRGPTTTAEWKSLWSSERFDAKKIDSYFAQWGDRFDLFHPKYPFMQIAGFETVKGETPVSAPVIRLLLEVASGNNATLFDHTTELEGRSLDAATAARALVTAQAWGLGGGQGPTSRNFGKHPYMAHAPCVGAVCTLVWGPTLFKTLCANLARLGGDVPFSSDAEDCPTWERATPRPPKAAVPTGYLEYLTWQARHVRLLPSSDGASVAEMYFAQGTLLDPETGYQNPFASVRVSDEKGELPVRLDPDRAIWRDSAALFAVPDHKSSKPPAAVSFCRSRHGSKLVSQNDIVNLACFGLANDKAKPLLWRREHLTATIRLLDDPEAVAELEAALSDIEATWTALKNALRKLAYCSLETDTKKPDRTEVTRIHDRLVSRVSFWDRVEDGFHVFVREPTPDARARWIDGARKAAHRALADQAAQFSQGSLDRRDRALALATSQLRRELPRPREDQGIESNTIAMEPSA